ncbi:MAG: hypothetical protein HOL13_07175 [Phycisphaerae bacterium]|nr:hypothetical protein [Phycisphaerae bacterium]
MPRTGKPCTKRRSSERYGGAVSRITSSVCEIRRSPDHPVVQPVSTHPLAAVTRRFCGLPATQPIVATGHQPVLPHPGILAKYIMVNRLASTHAACMVNAVVDTGTGPLGHFDVPCGGGHTLNMLDEGTGLWATRDAARVRPLQMPAGCAASIEQGIQEVSAAWLQSKGETAAHQAAAAQATVIRPWAGSFHNVWASQLLAAPIGVAVLHAMRDDPAGCVALYNEAVEAHPGLGVKLLRASGDFELPLWVVSNGSLQTATAQDLDVGGANLLPKALLTTALLRVAVADHFVHGIGGYAYDEIMEQWISRWLGWTPCPMSLATATVYLPGCSPAELDSETQRRVLKLRRLQHDPLGAGKVALSPSKAATLERIKAAGSASARAEAFATFHHDRQQAQEAAEVAKALCDVKASRAARASRARRDWACPLYPRQMLESLANAF